MEFAVWFFAKWLQDPKAWTEIGIAALAVVASTAVGVFAAWNGFTARKIASEASARDHEHRTQEAERLQRMARIEVAKAMADAVVATQYWADMLSFDWPLFVNKMAKDFRNHDPDTQVEYEGSASVIEAQKLANSAMLSALSIINIQVEAPNNRDLERWLGNSVGGIRNRMSAWQQSGVQFQAYASLGIGEITEHNLDEIHKWAHGPLANAPTPEMHRSLRAREPQV